MDIEKYRSQMSLLPGQKNRGLSDKHHSHKVNGNPRNRKKNPGLRWRAAKISSFLGHRVRKDEFKKDKARFKRKVVSRPVNFLPVTRTAKQQSGIFFRRLIKQHARRNMGCQSFVSWRTSKLILSSPCRNKNRTRWSPQRVCWPSYRLFYSPYQRKQRGARLTWTSSGSLQERVNPPGTGDKGTLRGKTGKQKNKLNGMCPSLAKEHRPESKNALQERASRYTQPHKWVAFRQQPWKYHFLLTTLRGRAA